jgi:hypothetical protein
MKIDRARSPVTTPVNDAVRDEAVGATVAIAVS